MTSTIDARLQWLELLDERVIYLLLLFFVKISKKGRGRKRKRKKKNQKPIASGWQWAVGDEEDPTIHD